MNWSGLLRPTPISLRVIVTVRDRKSTRLNSSHSQISYAVFCLKKKRKNIIQIVILARAGNHTKISHYVNTYAYTSREFVHLTYFHPTLLLSKQLMLVTCYPPCC